MASGVLQGRGPAATGQYVHPAQGGTDPRYAAQMRAVGVQASTHASARAATQNMGPEGYGAPQAQAAAAPRYDQHPGADQPGATGPADGAGLLNMLGAAVSVALVVGLGVWGYQLAVRDVSGVPVVRALEGPMRIQPEDPGGVVAPHQGLAVNDVAADGVSAGPVDQVVLAPPATPLSAEDVPAHPDAEVTASAQRPAAVPMPASGGEIDADAAVAEALGLTDVPGLEAPAATAPVEVIPESVPGVARSPRPRPRPSTFDDLPEITEPIRSVDVSASASTPPPARPAQTAKSAPAVVLGQEVAAAALDPSSRLVQLGAYKTPEAARDRWQAFAELNPDLFHNRNWTIDEGQSGGAPFYRLRAIGFDGIDDARAFCAALIAAQGSCVPVID